MTNLAYCVASNPLFIIPDFFCIFPMNFAILRQPTGKTFSPTFPKEFSHFFILFLVLLFGCWFKWGQENLLFKFTDLYSRYALWAALLLRSGNFRRKFWFSFSYQKSSLIKKSSIWCQAFKINELFFAWISGWLQTNPIVIMICELPNTFALFTKIIANLPVNTTLLTWNWWEDILPSVSDFLAKYLIWFFIDHFDLILF